MSEMLELIRQVVSVPAILVGIVACIGLVLQKADFETVVKGTIKTILGFLLISAGAGIVSGTLKGFGDLFQMSFGVAGIVPNSDAMAALLMKDFGASTASIMALGMVANIVLARFTRWKYIFLTGHICLYFSALIAATLTFAGLSGFMLILCGAMLLGLVMVSLPAIAQPAMRKVTKSDDIALGHSGTIAYWLAAQTGKLFANNKKSTEEINFPKTLSFMRDSSIAISIIMFVLYFIICLSAVSGHREAAVKIIGEQHWILYSLIQSISFAAGVYVILSGVRLVLAEIVPAFKGISEKLVPNAKPAIDCPVVFPFAPNAVLIGFISSFVGCLFGLGGIVVLNGFNMALMLILPGIVPQFFTGATAGVFGNAEGGIKGCVAGAFINGFISTFLSAYLMPMFLSFGYNNITFGDSDFNAVSLIFINLAGWLGASGMAGVIAVLFFAPIIYSLCTKQQAAVKKQEIHT